MAHSKFRAYESRQLIELHGLMSLLLCSKWIFYQKSSKTFKMAVFRIREIRVEIPPVSIVLGKLNSLSFKPKSVQLAYKYFWPQDVLVRKDYHKTLVLMLVRERTRGEEKGWGEGEWSYCISLFVPSLKWVALGNTVFLPMWLATWSPVHILKGFTLAELAAKYSVKNSSLKTWIQLQHPHFKRLITASTCHTSIGGRQIKDDLRGALATPNVQYVFVKGTLSQEIW